VRDILADLEHGEPRVVSRFVSIQGKRFLAGVAYLPEIGWHEITLMDLDILVPMGDFIGLPLAFAATLILALLFFNVVINRLLLRPLSLLDASMSKVQAGEDISMLSSQAPGELGRLMGHFKHMAKTVRDERLNLEHTVAMRTEALDRLTKQDSLTGLFNRRGMRVQIEREMSRAERLGTRFGLLWLDIDWFKGVNDTYGHGVGDQALVSVANLIAGNIRPYDSASRWGGDEFLIMQVQADMNSLQVLGERIRQAVADTCKVGDPENGIIQLSVSIGAYLCHPGEDLDSLLQMADRALYVAKEAGRNRMQVIAEPPDSPE
jgi:diguanylate cyclase (GGDEF)-like protein